ncbi:MULTISPECIES: protealysin inhibitor emfourin [unclassified Duganella]|uniref:protealysin inhibitor emfourin n=1 Tax=unclassified Duganella TaxID=2636909 RepID=UPI0018F39143|nr:MULTISPECIES: protealysin inhibitor emfourin [unclassified Duganella]
MTRLSLRCTGGFTGPAGAQTRTVDLSLLPPHQAHELEHLLTASDFFALPDQLLKPAPCSSDFLYDLKVDQGQQAHCIRYHLDAAPAPLKELTDKLSEADPD